MVALLRAEGGEKGPRSAWRRSYMVARRKPTALLGLFQFPKTPRYRVTRAENPSVQGHARVTLYPCAVPM